MRSVRLVGPAAITCVEAPLPNELGADQVEVILEMAGICGSDKPGFITGVNENGETPAGYPVHECVGTVSRSSGDQSLVGRRVIAIPNNDAGLSERFHASITKLHVIQSRLPLSTIILAQPLATVLAALDRVGDVHNQRVAVIGLGPIGLKIGFVLRQRGAAHIAGFDPRDRTHSPLVSAFDRIETGPVPIDEFDLVVDAVGHNEDVVNSAIEAAAHRGTVLFFGVPDSDTYRIKFNRFFRKNLMMVANVQPDWSRYLPMAEEFLVNHPELSALVTDICPVDSVEKAYEAAFLGDGFGRGKVLISVDSWLNTTPSSDS
jgi:L-iditol 2-dehydrogenase